MAKKGKGGGSSTYGSNAQAADSNTSVTPDGATQGGQIFHPGAKGFVGPRGTVVSNASGIYNGAAVPGGDNEMDAAVKNQGGTGI